MQVGQTLTASTSGIADADGLDNATFTYQWVANDSGTDTDIAGATGSTYTLADGDADKTIKLKVTFTDDASHAETLTSTATAAVTVPLPASFEDMPASHDGTAVFEFRVRFSEAMASKRAVVRAAFAVTGGAVVGLVRSGELSQ